jgi:hypothetical protein
MPVNICFTSTYSSLSEMDFFMARSHSSQGELDVSDLGTFIRHAKTKKAEKS